jgi:TPR repeat protein
VRRTQLVVGAILQEMAFSEYSADAALKAFDCQDYETVLKLASPHAVAGNPEAQCMVSLLHQCGFGVERNVLEAERWLLKAAEQNFPGLAVRFEVSGTRTSLERGDQMLPTSQRAWV